MSDQQRLSQETVFDLLSSARRRYILYYLREHEGEATINELATQIAAWENDRPVEELTSQDEKRVYVSLYQTHVPKLEQAGIVEYDGDTGLVTLTDRAGQFDRYLAGVDEERFPIQLYYLAVAVVAGGVMVLAVFEVPPFATVGAVTVGAAAIVVFAASAVAQFLLGRYGEDRIPSELQVQSEEDGDGDG
jgi:DNA-binding transcriptional ArsR family regulator